MFLVAEQYEDPPAVPSFRSWVGSDCDGNPFVTPEVTTRTFECQRALAIEEYDAELADVGGVLSQKASISTL